MGTELKLIATTYYDSEMAADELLDHARLRKSRAVRYRCHGCRESLPTWCFRFDRHRPNERSHYCTRCKPE